MLRWRIQCFTKRDRNIQNSEVVSVLFRCFQIKKKPQIKKCKKWSKQTVFTVGNSTNKGKSLMMLWDLREVPMIFSAVLTTLFFSEALGLPNQMEIQLVSTLSTVPRQKVVRLGGGRCAIFTQCSKCRYC